MCYNRSLRGRNEDGRDQKRRVRQESPKGVINGRGVRRGAEATEKGEKLGGEVVLRRGGYVNTIPGRKWLGVF